MVCARLTKMLMAVKVNMTDITQRLRDFIPPTGTLWTAHVILQKRGFQSGGVGLPREIPNSFRAGSENKVKQNYTGAKRSHKKPKCVRLVKAIVRIYSSFAELYSLPTFPESDKCIRTDHFLYSSLCSIRSNINIRLSKLNCWVSMRSKRSQRHPGIEPNYVNNRCGGG